MKENLQKYLMEFIGTFFLVFTVGAMVFISGFEDFTPVAVGAILMIMVYAGAHISGGHYNPAVSLSAVIRGTLMPRHFIPYFIAQLAGAAAAMYAVLLIAAPVEVSTNFNVLGVIIGEFLFTFALCFVVLSTAATEENRGNSFFGLAIGSIVMVGALTLGGKLCAAAFNPAIALGLGITSLINWKLVLITMIVNFAAGILAALVYKFLNNYDLTDF